MKLCLQHLINNPIQCGLFVILSGFLNWIEIGTWKWDPCFKQHKCIQHEKRSLYLQKNMYTIPDAAIITPLDAYIGTLEHECKKGLVCHSRSKWGDLGCSLWHFLPPSSKLLKWEIFLDYICNCNIYAVNSCHVLFRRRTHRRQNYPLDGHMKCVIAKMQQQAAHLTLQKKLPWL